MTTRVDVLAVLDAYVDHWSKELIRTRKDFDIHNAARSELAVARNAREAVAELIEAASAVSTSCAYNYGDATGLHLDLAASGGLNERLAAALARVKGA